MHRGRAIIIKILLFAGVLSLPTAGAAAAQPIRIKLATAAPKGTCWDRALQELSQQLEQETDGRLKLTIYAGGMVGDESNIVRKMRVGQFQAAMVTSVGMSIIDSSITALSHIPLFYDSYEEFDYVRDQLADELEQRFYEKGYFILNWGEAGWVHFFTQSPMTHPDDLKPMKLFFWANESGDPSIWLDLGYHPVPLASTEVMMGLQTGLIDAFDTTPLVALGKQWFALAPHMCDMRWAPLVGATILRRDIWDKILPQDQIILKRLAINFGEAIKKEGRELELLSIQVMVEHGLIVHPVSDEYQKLWKESVEQAYPRIRGNIVPTEYFDRVHAIRSEYRGLHKSK
ncbi:MAG: TRAP transporter substrate-binding protein DctP [Candidatus Marinimicrobia bacterium]|nr:TRAP transporter substrate-binding protein DctP [Candidatus Neomarinimicrobiota bacterium]